MKIQISYFFIIILFGFVQNLIAQDYEDSNYWSDYPQYFQVGDIEYQVDSIRGSELRITGYPDGLDTTIYAVGYDNDNVWIKLDSIEYDEEYCATFSYYGNWMILGDSNFPLHKSEYAHPLEFAQSEFDVLYDDKRSIINRLGEYLLTTEERLEQVTENIFCTNFEIHGYDIDQMVPVNYCDVLYHAETMKKLEIYGNFIIGNDYSILVANQTDDNVLYSVYSPDFDTLVSPCSLDKLLRDYNILELLDLAETAEYLQLTNSYFDKKLLLHSLAIEGIVADYGRYETMEFLPVKLQENHFNYRCYELSLDYIEWEVHAQNSDLISYTLYMEDTDFTGGPVSYALFAYFRNYYLENEQWKELKWEHIFKESDVLEALLKKKWNEKIDLLLEENQEILISERDIPTLVDGKNNFTIHRDHILLNGVIDNYLEGSLDDYLGLDIALTYEEIYKYLQKEFRKEHVDPKEYIFLRDQIKER